MIMTEPAFEELTAVAWLLKYFGISPRQAERILSEHLAVCDQCSHTVTYILRTSDGEDCG